MNVSRSKKMQAGLLRMAVATFVVLGFAVASSQAAIVAQYDFDLLSGGNTIATDISGNGHDVTYNRVVSSITDDPFSSPTSNSVATSITTTVGNSADPASINLNNGGQNSFTIEAWVKPNSVSVNQTVAELRSTTGAASRFGLWIDDTGVIEGRFFPWVVQEM